METKNLDDLNARVTDAIFRAERLPPGPLANEAFTKVCLLEQLIAFETSPVSTEGCFARCGAVTAAISAGAFARAIRLAKFYCQEPISPELYDRLLDLQNQALDAWIRSTHPGPWIVPKSNPGYHYVDDAEGETVAKVDSAHIAEFIAESANAFLTDQRKASAMATDYPTHHDQCERAFTVVHEYGNDIVAALATAYGSDEGHPAIAMIQKIQEGTQRRAAAGTTP